MRSKTIFNAKRVYVTDFGAEEYLDGAMMRYSVESRRKYPNGETLAYFSHEAHARLFAEALAAAKEKPNDNR